MKDEELIEGSVPQDWTTSDEIIKVLGVGGGGCNAVDYMYKQGIKGCTFAVCNSDAVALQGCSVPVKIPIGTLGAGTVPEVGRQYAMEASEPYLRHLYGRGVLVQDVEYFFKGVVL